MIADAQPYNTVSNRPLPKQPISVGMLGGGMMAQIGHLPFLVADARCNVVCISESRPSLFDALSELVGRENIVPDYRDMLNNPEIDAVVISAPRPSTGPLTLDALNAGKHVLAEKPMAHTVDQAELLVEAARQNAVLYSLGYMKRFDPGVETAARLFSEFIGTGQLGELLMARFYDYSKSYALPPPPHIRPAESRQERFETWPLWPDWLGAEHRDAYAWFLNAASHDVNLLRLFFPKADEVVAARCLADGSASVLIEAGSVPVHLEVTKSGLGRWCEGGEFVFERGRLRFAVPSPMDTSATTQVRLDSEPEGLVDHTVETESGWSFARQVDGFLGALTGIAELRNSGDECLEDMRLSEKIWRTATG